MQIEQTLKNIILFYVMSWNIQRWAFNWLMRRSWLSVIDCRKLWKGLKNSVSILLGMSLLNVFCGTPADTRISGVWIIDSISYGEGKDSLNNLLSNMMGFDDDYQCWFPSSKGGSQLNEGNWKMIYTDNYTYLVISSKSVLFNDTFNVNFIYADLMRMVLRSDSVYISCSKTWPTQRHRW